MDNNQTHCMALLREADYDRYLSILYAPEDKRGALAALYAFNVEVARIRDSIHEPLPGEIRLQWWRDVIHGSAQGDFAGHPVAAAFVQAINHYNLPTAALDNYCEARIFDLYDDAMPSRTDLEGYCGETASTIIQLAGLIFDKDAASETASAAGHAGVAQAVTGLLRLMPLHRARGQAYVPSDMLDALGVSREIYLEGTDSSANSRIVAAMVALAREHLTQYKALNVSVSLKPTFMPLALTPAYLKAIEKLGGKAVSQVAEISTIRKQWLMFKSNI